MSRMNLEDVRVWDPILEKGVKGGVMIQTLAGTMALDRDSPHICAIDPGGATRVVTLPTNEKGLWWIIINTADAAEDLTINDPAATTRGTISQNEIAIVVMDGTRSYVGTMTTT